MERSLPERLESGEIVVFEPCAFVLPLDEDLAFLREQRPAGGSHKDICFNPARDVMTGYHQVSPLQAERLRRILQGFAQQAATWLAGLLPGYARAWSPDRVSFRAEEEAIRKLRRTARNDLLHFDAFPSRPTGGRRILRLYVNVSPSDPRVWATSDTFRQVFERYGVSAGLPGSTVDGWPQRLLGLLQPGAAQRTAYDSYMLRLHHYLKTSNEFQEQSPRKLWHFAPGAAWLFFADAISHAELRGQFALEHSFFVAAQTLALPEESPLVILEKACGPTVARRAA